MDGSSIASGGSGESSGLSSRSSAPNLLFAVPLLLIGLVLLTTTRCFFRVKTALGLGLCAALAGWALTVSRQGSKHLDDLVIWGITAALFLAGAALGATILWPLGLAGLSVAAGFVFACSILVMGRDGLIHSIGGRWGFLAALGVASLACLAFAKAHLRASVELVQGSLCGAFILCLSIDLFINGATGASRGLRHILDTNSYHQPYLSYTPKLSTQLLMAFVWLLTPVSAYAQYRIFRKAQASPHPQNIYDDVEQVQEPEKVEEVEEGIPTVTHWPGSEEDAEKATSAPKSRLKRPKSKLNISQLPIVAIERRQQEMEQGVPVEAKISVITTISRPYRAHLRASSSDSASSSSSSSSNAEGYSSRPRPYSMPSSHSRSNSDHAPPRHYRHSSALPLPSMSYVISPEIDINGSPLPSPPNSRNNSRRNSWAVGYATPPRNLDAHHEEGSNQVSQGDLAMVEAEDLDNKQDIKNNQEHHQQISPLVAQEASEKEEKPAKDSVETIVVPVEQPSSSSSSASSGNSDSSHSGYEDPLARPITPLEAAPVIIWESNGSSDRMHLASVVVPESKLVGRVVASAQAKDITARCTIDDWATFEDISSVKNDNLVGTDWIFEIAVSKLGGPGSRLQLAIRAVFADGREEWDSNNGENYVLRLP